MSTRTQLGIAVCAYVALCVLCLWRHGPRIEAALRPAPVARPAAPPPPPPEPPRPPAELRVALEDGAVALSGRVAGEAERAQLRGGAGALYGAGHRSRVEIGAAPAPWQASLSAMLPPLGRDLTRGSLRVGPAGVIVEGEAVSKEARDRYVAALRAAAGSLPLDASGLKVVDAKLSAAEVKLQTSLFAQIEGKTVEFSPNSDVITPAGQQLLDLVAAVLRDAPPARVEVGGHTDDVGGAAWNQSLSERRARATLRYLASHGAAAARLRAVGYGATRPLADNRTAEGRQKNRRIEFRIDKSH